MRKLKALMLIAILSLSSFGTSATFAQAGKDKPLKDAEYNLGLCGGRSFTEGHAVIETKDGKQTFTITHQVMDAEGTVVKDPDPVILAIDKSAIDANAIIQFHAQVELDKDLVEMSGFVKGNKLVIIQATNGELSHLFYGYTDKVDNIMTGYNADLKFCLALHQVSLEAIPAALLTWLIGDLPQTNGVLSHS